MSLVDPELTGDVGRNGRDHPRAGTGAHQDRADLLRAASRLCERGLRGLQGEFLERQGGVAALLDPGLFTDLVGRHGRPVVGRIADQVLVAADLITVHDSKGFQPGQHGKIAAYGDFAVGPDRPLGLPGGGDGPARRAVAQPAQEPPDLLVPWVEGHDEIVVLELADLSELDLRPVPRILVVQDHRPAMQRLEVGHILVTVDDVGEVVNRVVRVVAR